MRFDTENSAFNSKGICELFGMMSPDFFVAMLQYDVFSIKGKVQSRMLEGIKLEKLWAG